MRILQVNKFYPFKDMSGNTEPGSHYPVGGTEALIQLIDSILTKQGHRVIHFSMKHPRDLTGPFSSYFAPYINLHYSKGISRAFISGKTVLYNNRARKQLARLLDDFPVDIAHLHSIYHQLSPAIIHELRSRHIPVVMTLHDFKLVCPSYNMLYRGKICEACKGRRFYHCMVKRCHTNSLYKSLLVTLESYLHHFILNTYQYVRHFICPSRFLMEKVREMGLQGTFFHLPNVIDSTEFQPDYSWTEPSIVYFGRLIKIKGLFTMIDAVKNIKKIHLKIIGDGPLKQALQDKLVKEQIKNISLLGYKKGNDLRDEIKKSMFAILPSEVYENYPYTVLESFALGKPVIGSGIGGIPELCIDDKTGFTFTPGNSRELADKINFMISHPDMIKMMGKNARRLVETTNTPELYYNGLIDIYKQVQKV